VTFDDGYERALLQEMERITIRLAEIHRLLEEKREANEAAGQSHAP
jgi:hypothetical protein